MFLDGQLGNFPISGCRSICASVFGRKLQLELGDNHKNKCLQHWLQEMGGGCWGSASNIKSRSGSVWCWLELHHAANIFAFLKIVNWDDCTQRIYVRDQCNINAVHSHLCPLKRIAYFWETSRILLTFLKHYQTLSANKHDYFSKYDFTPRCHILRKLHILSLIFSSALPHSVSVSVVPRDWPSLVFGANGAGCGVALAGFAGIGLGVNSAAAHNWQTVKPFLWHFRCVCLLVYNPTTPTHHHHHPLHAVHLHVLAPCRCRLPVVTKVYTPSIWTAFHYGKDPSNWNCFCSRTYWPGDGCCGTWAIRNANGVGAILKARQNSAANAAHFFPHFPPCHFHCPHLQPQRQSFVVLQGDTQGLEKPPTKRISGPYPQLEVGGCILYWQIFSWQ